MTKKHTKHNGYAALLMLLIVLVIGMMLYFVDIRAIFGPSIPTRPAKIEERPWRIENLIVPEEQDIKLPRPSKIDITEPLELAAQVQRNGQPRGSVKLRIAPDGRLLAKWESFYTHEKRSFKITAKITGNIDAKYLCNDETGNPDDSLLFFIGKGQYQQLTSVENGPAAEENGTVYLIGSLSPQKQIHGTLTITTDQSWSAVYEFQKTK